MFQSDSKLISDGVRQYVLPGGKLRITQISTFCPDDVGPGPTNLHLIEADALILMDTGIPTQFAQSMLYSWFNRPIPPDVEGLPPDLSERQLCEGIRLGGYSIADIDLLVISHGHWDHFLQGRAILRQCQALVAAHVLDTPLICNPWMSAAFWMSRGNQLKATGMPMVEPRLAATVGGPGLDGLDFALKVHYPIFGDGSLELDSPIRGVQVKHLPGHTPGSIGLIVGQEGQERVLLPGDVILDPITPHPDDLLAYLRTLDDLSELEDISLVLPAHGDEIRDLKARVAFLQGHHRRRLRLTHEACQQSKSVWDVATIEGYFDVDVDKKKTNFLAGSEALIHMEMLRMVDALHRSTVRKGVHHFESSNESFDEVYNRIMALVRDRQTVPLMRY